MITNNAVKSVRVLALCVVSLAAFGRAALADTPPPGTPPPKSTGDGTVAGIPAPGGGRLYSCADALIGGFDWFEKLHGWFPSVMHTSHATSPTGKVVDMAYATPGTMTFKNVEVASAGTYSVTFRYAFASGLFGGINDRPEGIKVNGVVVTNNMHFPITHSFSTYKDSSVTVSLRAGKNEIVMFNVTDHGVSRLDTMIVK